MKDELRKKLKIKRRYFSGVRREYADLAIAEDFIAAYGGYQSFLVYRTLGSEAGTEKIIESLLSLNKKVFLPRVEDGEIVAVPYGETKKGAFGVEEPQGSAYTGEIDVTVTPLLAVNSNGYRIGYGGGYYDRFFKRTSTLKVGLGYSFQIEEFTQDEWDVPLDAFLCERGIYGFGK